MCKLSREAVIKPDTGTQATLRRVSFGKVGLGKLYCLPHVSRSPVTVAQPDGARNKTYPTRSA